LSSRKAAAVADNIKEMQKAAVTETKKAAVTITKNQNMINLDEFASCSDGEGDIASSYMRICGDQASWSPVAQKEKIRGCEQAKQNSTVTNIKKAFPINKKKSQFCRISR
jgi:hypothetical protein